MMLMIVGVPHSGKTTLAKAITQMVPGAWSIYHCDAYKHLPWDQQPLALLGDLAHAKTHHVCIEGVMATRLLHSGTNGDRPTIKPDAILECIRGGGLASPKHKGLATKIERDMIPWRSSSSYYEIPDVRAALGTIQAVAKILELDTTQE